MRKNYFFIFLLLFVLGCGKKSGIKKQKLAVDYYKMSLFESVSYRRALQHINKALAVEVRPRYLAHKATLLFLLGVHDESQKCFKQALGLAKSPAIRSEILNNYACLLANGGNKREALRLFVQLEHDKNYLTPEVALVNQAKLYCDEGDWHRARGKLAQATRVAPEYVDAFYYLGLVCYAIAEYDASLEAIERTLELESGHVGAKELALRLRRKFQ